ncbi:MAG: UDP-N-acetylmuramate--L-alanine ligase [Proteobacteria bacterium]|nr:UDP-N-acetylmuramate--L-alanine ligase [Pseudomonadota bacterium]
MYKGDLKIHFVGIGGIGMSGIAEVLNNLGYKVSGSDIKETDTTKRLEGLGIKVYYGHKPENIRDTEVLVVSSAIKKDNPELLEAKRLGIPVILRAEMLAELMRMKYSILIAGTHGKTTTSSLIAHMMHNGGMDPTLIVGGKLNNFGTNAKLGQGTFVVAEADESDGSFLLLSPTIAVVTNIEREHMDHYGTYENLERAFIDFLNKVPFYGLNIVCLDNAGVQKIIPKLNRRVITYGLSHQADLRAENIINKERESEFDVIYFGESLGRFKISIPGKHNVLNSLASIAVGLELGMDIEKMKESFITFRGIQRRFQIKGEEKGIVVVDDYGHHPTEIKATLDTARNFWKGRVIALFQPHRYTRTQDLFEEFLTSFYDADVVLVMDIYSASEDEIPGVSGLALAEGIRAFGHKNSFYVGDKDTALNFLRNFIKEGDLLITLGAGDVYKVGEKLLEELKNA